VREGGGKGLQSPHPSIQEQHKEGEGVLFRKLRSKKGGWRLLKYLGKNEKKLPLHASTLFSNPLPGKGGGKYTEE